MHFSVACFGSRTAGQSDASTLAVIGLEADLTYIEIALTYIEIDASQSCFHKRRGQGSIKGLSSASSLQF